MMGRAVMPSFLATSGWIGPALYYALAAVVGGSALFVVVSRNIVHTAVALMFTLVGVAGLYLLLEAEFLAAVQLVIYVGGTLILIVFGVMLTSKSPFTRFSPSRGEAVLAGGIGVMLLTTLVLAIGAGRRAPMPFAVMTSSESGKKPLTLPSPGVPEEGTEGKQNAPESDGYPMAALGQLLQGEYLVPFEVVSVILLVVMVGAAYLARRRRPS